MWKPEGRAGQARGLVKLRNTSGDSGVRKCSHRAQRSDRLLCWEQMMLGTHGSPAALGLPALPGYQVFITVMETGIKMVLAAFAIITVMLEMFFSRLNFHFRTLGSVFTIEMVINELCLKKVIFFLLNRAL